MPFSRITKNVTIYHPNCNFGSVFMATLVICGLLQSDELDKIGCDLAIEQCTVLCVQVACDLYQGLRSVF